MSRAVKQLLKACWKGLHPLLAPLVRRFDDHLNDHTARMMTQLTVWNSQQRESIREVELLGDSIVRELARLHAKIALLEANLLDAARASDTRSAEADARPLSQQPTSRAA
ncbi:MAG TPA: hypothetical protein VHB99_11020 [Pirellulales bacterium]|nr:hypothetical protein [Pirellulales bacterium]